MASVGESGGKAPVAGSTVAGYFAEGEDARRAIDALMEKGFDVREIGAAFHSREQRDPMLAVEEEPEERLSSKDNSMAGVASGSRGVTPSGLSTGGGTGIPGAPRPGPITGAELPSDLPREIPSTLLTDAEVREERSWREQLEAVFGRESGAGRGSAKDSGKWGISTGKGNPGEIADYAYSGAAFEKSFTDMGIPPEHARRVAHELQHGGAVVTVKAGARAAEAESVLLQNHGIIRYETPAARRVLRRDTDGEAARMEIFGEVYRVYPHYIPPEKQIARKAS